MLGPPASARASQQHAEVQPLTMVLFGTTTMGPAAWVAYVQSAADIPRVVGPGPTRLTGSLLVCAGSLALLGIARSAA